MFKCIVVEYVLVLLFCKIIQDNISLPNTSYMNGMSKITAILYPKDEGFDTICLI